MEDEEQLPPPPPHGSLSSVPHSTSTPGSTSDSPDELSISPSSSSCPSPSPSPPRSSPCANTLHVRNLSYTVQRQGAGGLAGALRESFFRCSAQKPKSVDILKSVSFAARSSEIVAVVGPSGAGKSTLLRVVSGRIRSAKFDRRTISFNEKEMRRPSQLRKLCGYVTQEDNLLPLLTVEETLMFSSRFLLQGCGEREKRERVQCLMRELGLTHVAGRYVGNEEVRGISGGERKRVSIAVDVIHNPPILLLDEPTSGLDSSSALQVVELLATMARARRQILILTIHQPSYRILRYFSTFLLLSRGAVAHYGGLRSLEEAIARLGETVPAQLNALEFAMEIMPKLEEYSYSRKKTHALVQQPRWSEESMTVNPERREDVDSSSTVGYCSRWVEVSSLSWRFWRVMYRTKQLFLARTMQAVVGGFGLGSVYLHVKSDAAGAAERLGLFAFTLSFLLSSTVEALPIFLQERRVLMREASRGMYRLSSYMVAHAAVFLPFLLVISLLFSAPVYWLVGLNPAAGAFAFFALAVWMILLMASSLVLFLGSVSPDFILGNSLIGICLGVFFLFSGYFIPRASIPWYWIYMYYASIYRYPLDALLVNEYWSMRDRCFSWVEQQGGSARRCSLTGGDVLRMRGLEGDTRWTNVVIMLGFFLLYRLLAWVVLVRRASKTIL
ncbi:hypothetical protein Taro_050644 [Colocasia esculenta]|uniref:ABC transporter domain-containing protein n=1 Tax=Colocasia esculenta TaxID=4460 RepID=A0A843XEH7_COLES|nr:hypothetical protein [Colocasia esculenta]